MFDSEIVRNCVKIVLFRRLYIENANTYIFPLLIVTMGDLHSPVTVIPATCQKNQALNCRRQAGIKTKSSVQVLFFEKQVKIQLSNSNIPRSA